MTRIDLTGQVFGRLTVLSPGENIDGKTTWNCRCICGNHVLVTTKNLRLNRTKHCGCMKHKSGLLSLHYVEGSCIEMLESKKIRSNNKSGYSGVFYDQTSGKWRVEMMLQGKRKYLGRYDDKEMAISIRKQAEDDIRQKFIDTHKIEETEEEEAESSELLTI